MTGPDNPVYQQWLREERDRLLAAFERVRPAAFAAKGNLHPDIHAWLESLVQGNATTLLLGGRTGVGKTWSAWKAVETLIYNGWRGTWAITPMYDLFRLTAPPVDEAELDRLARVDLLVLDDLGSIAPTEWRNTHLHGLIDHRWTHRLPTMLTTNVQNLEEILTERITSRLADGMISIGLNGHDRRWPA